MDERRITYESDRLEPWRYSGAVFITVILHGFILLLLSSTPPLKLTPLIAPSISVEIIESTAPKPPVLAPQNTPAAPPTLTNPPSPQPFLPEPSLPEPPLSAPPLSEKVAPPAAPSLPSSRPAEALPPPAVPNIIAGPQIEADKDKDDTSVYIPSRWALEPALSKDRLSGIFGDGFQKDISCIRSLSEDCISLRKEVFADYQLTEQDLVWTESFAHSGLTNPALHGLSEYNIRKRLGAPIAGDNAFVILPGIAIDGNLWDTLHGVNKKCPVLRGVRRCPPLKPKADDKRFHIPKKDTP